MNDTNTARIGLTEGEARAVINALSNYEVGVSGEEEETALNVERLLQREFGFEQRQLRGDRNIADFFPDIFGGGGDREIQLSRGEAVEVVRALDDHKENVDPTQALTVSDLYDRFRDTFDIDGSRRS